MNHPLLGHPRWARRYCAAFVVVCAGILLGLKVAGASTLSWPVVAAVIVIVALLSWRTAVLGVEANDRRLVVRNFFRTTAIDRHDIDGVRAGRAPTRPFGGTGVIVTTTGGRVVHLTITARTTRLLGSRRVEEDLATLRAWRAGQ